MDKMNLLSLVNERIKSFFILMKEGYKFKDKIIVVVYIKGSKANISGRGKRVKDFILKAISGLEDSRGGGHEDAVGAQVRVEDIENLRGNLLKLVG